MTRFLQLAIVVLITFITTISSASGQNASVPTKITSVRTLQSFFSHKPKFKCKTTGVVLQLTYTDGKFIAYVNDKRFGVFEVDVRNDQPYYALIGLPWLNGYGPAPMLLTLKGDKTTLQLLPVQGEQNLSFNSRGYLQHGRTGSKTWMKLSLSSSGVSFTPVNNQPDPELFIFIGFPSSATNSSKTATTTSSSRQSTTSKPSSRIKIRPDGPENAEVKITPEFLDSIHQYDAVFPFHEGIAAVRSKENDRIGYINTKGELVIPCQFLVAGAFSEGLAFVLIEDEVCFIDRTGKIYNTQYRRSRSLFFSRDWQDGYTGNNTIRFIDGICEDEDLGIKITYNTLTGTNPPYTTATDDSEYEIFSEESTDYRGKQVKHLGLKKNGEIVIPASYSHVTPFSNGVANVVMDVVHIGSCNAENRYIWICGFIDKNGNTTFTDADYAKLEKFKKDYPHWTNNN